MAETTPSKVSPSPEKPGPRNPDPLPASNAAGYAAVPSEEDVVPGAVGNDPRSPNVSGEAGSRPAKATNP